eukprot:CAMPEP_0171058706 /NCGR_PEP_ID=MMETSP0766_2-20121228/2679_1 /TAXON_ID=439317 /ORGANISM="Gambierdiscus australes, Strain CAWD 149" /LENGTH=175 /DNA_ID=CAMNT_0011514023 /DNA_START=20 /DNA_END=545 /DNA_ORIENTATION=+
MTLGHVSMCCNVGTRPLGQRLQALANVGVVASRVCANRVAIWTRAVVPRELLASVDGPEDQPSTFGSERSATPLHAFGPALPSAAPPLRAPRKAQHVGARSMRGELVEAAAVEAAAATEHLAAHIPGANLVKAIAVLVGALTKYVAQASQLPEMVSVLPQCMQHRAKSASSCNCR